MDINRLLDFMVEKKASDLFITADYPPSVKLDGRMTPVAKTPLTAEQSRAIVLGLMNEEQRQEFQAHRECNFAIVAGERGRFRVSAFQQRNRVGLVARRIETEIPTLEALNLPGVLADLIMSKRGLIIFVGATGTGKSTSLAAMLGHRNRNSRGHIITIEDPIEFVHEHAGCIVTQREVGVDTDSFEVALKNTLRQAPDVIMLGEVRSRETMDHALAFAETGHLAVCTLHANNANQALDRIINFFPADRHEQVWMDLSLNLRAIVAQQLVPTRDGNGRRAAIEVLLNTPLVADTVREGDVHLLKEIMAKSGESGMQTFDQALYALYAGGEIDYEAAIAHADSPNDLRLLIKMGADSDQSRLSEAAASLSLQDTDDH